MSILWKDWPTPMDVTTIESNGNTISFSLTGICPHCARQTVLVIFPATVYKEDVHDKFTKCLGQDIAAITRCPGCRKFVLAVVWRDTGAHTGQPSTQKFSYKAHYPIGLPDDSIEDGIPREIGEDFKEALRCRFVNAFKAVTCMCGRALEASCAEQRATGRTLQDKIDSLAEKGVITNSLKNMAHRIRITRNRGAHIPEDQEEELQTPGKEEADALIEFTREYFHHVYTMPFKEKKFTEKLPNADDSWKDR